MKNHCKTLLILGFSTVLLACSEASSSEQKVEECYDTTRESITVNSYYFDEALNNLVVTVNNCTNEKHSVCVVNEETEPVKTSLRKRQYIEEGKTEYIFDTSSYVKGKRYYVTLITETFDMIDYREFKVLGTKRDDCSPVCASWSSEGGVYKVKITPRNVYETQEYELFWCKGNQRLTDYTYIKQFESSGSDEFEVQLPNYIYAPDEADSIEVFTKTGTPKSIYLECDNLPKLKQSTLKYTFAGISDVHIQGTNKKSESCSHLRNIYRTLDEYFPDSKAIFIAGDDVSDGTRTSYETFKAVEDEFKATHPDVLIYHALGNHNYQSDNINGTTFEDDCALFEEITGCSSKQSSFDFQDARVLYINTVSGYATGVLDKATYEWVEDELESHKDQKVYIFTHFPLKDTVSGSLSDQKEDCWGYGTLGLQLKTLINKYPNVFYFSGHSHFSADSTRPILPYTETNATYLNLGCTANLYKTISALRFGSEGYFIQVYEDYMLFRCRHTSLYKWCSYGAFCVEL